MLISMNLIFTNADRGEIQKGTAEIFFRKVKFWKEDGQEEAPPVFVGIILLRMSSSISIYAQLMTMSS